MIVLKFFVDEYQVVNASGEGKAIHLAEFLTDNINISDIEWVQFEIENILARGETWSHSLNKTYLEVSTKSIRCSDLYHKEHYIEIQHAQFFEMLTKWKLFVSNSIKQPIEIRI